MKNIYVNQNILTEAVDYLNNEMTFFGFLTHVKKFLKSLLTNPINAEIDEYLLKNGISKKQLLGLLIDRNVVEKNTNIVQKNGKDNFVISFKVPKNNFERKIRRIYTTLFEEHIINDSEFMFEDGATSCGSAMQGGGLNSDSGQYVSPIGKVQRRTFYITNEQYKLMQEMATSDAGNYQYDVPLSFNKGNDPAYNHKNMIKKSHPIKKRNSKN